MRIVLPEIQLSWVLVAVVYTALGEGPIFGMMLGVFAGFLWDLLGIGRMGLSTAEMGMVGLFAGFLSTNLFRESPLTQVLLPALFVFLLTLINGGIGRFYFHETPPLFNLDWLFAAVSSPFIFLFLKKVQRSRRW